MALHLHLLQSMLHFDSFLLLFCWIYWLLPFYWQLLLAYTTSISRDATYLDHYPLLHLPRTLHSLSYFPAKVFRSGHLLVEFSLSLLMHFLCWRHSSAGLHAERNLKSGHHPRRKVDQTLPCQYDHRTVRSSDCRHWRVAQSTSVAGSLQEQVRAWCWKEVFCRHASTDIRKCSGQSQW